MRHAIGDCVDGRYEIRSLLGEGSMGEAYRALDKRTGGEVVLKEPHLAIAGDLTAFKRYRPEIEVAAGLDCPGLQRLLSDPTAHHMVLDYVEGQTLRSYLAKHGRLAVGEVISIGVQLAETLAYVHGQGVIHRDLKPDNVLIGPDGHVTLTDFGIAQRMSARRPTFAQLSNAVGTPDYMAPEQVRGQRGDARTDVYALGAMLFELLTGEVPYPARDALNATRRSGLTDPPLVSRLRPDAPPALEAILYRALRRRPEERYPSMAALRHDLTHLDPRGLRAGHSATRAIRLGVWITVQHPLLYALGGSLLKLWGAERTQDVMPVRAWLDEGAQLSAGTDYPIGTYSPLETVWGMTTRQTDQVGVQGPEYAVDRATAVWLAGAATANLLCESTSLGSIQPGHFADLVAYHSDPLTCPLDELRRLRPAWTLVGGRVIYGQLSCQRRPSATSQGSGRWRRAENVDLISAAVAFLGRSRA